MSTYYDIFTEVYSDGKWKNIDLYYKNARGEFKIIPVLSGISTLGRALENYGDYYPLGRLKEGLSEEVSDYVGKAEDWQLRVWDIGSILKDLDSSIPEWSCYVPKAAVNKYLLGDIEALDDVDHLTVEDFKELSPEEKQGYRYFEWTSDYGEVYMLNAIKTSADLRISRYNEDYWGYPEKQANYDNVRFVVFIS